MSTRDSGARCKQVQCVAGGPAAEDSHTHLRDCGREWCSWASVNEAPGPG